MSPIDNNKFVDTVYTTLLLSYTSSDPSPLLAEELESKNLVNKNVSKELAETLALAILNENPDLSPSKRYRFQTQSNRNHLLQIFFERAYKQSPGQFSPFLTKDEKSSFDWPTRKLEVLNKVNKVVASPWTRVIVYACAASAAIFVLYKSYNKVVDLVGRVSQICITHTPELLVQTMNKVIAVKNYIWDNAFYIFSVAFVIRLAIINMPNMPKHIKDKAQKINMGNIFWSILLGPRTIFGFLAEKGVEAIKLVHNEYNDMTLIVKNQISSLAGSMHGQIKDLSSKKWKQVITDEAPAIA